MWSYSQSTGGLRDAAGDLTATGYSGYAAGKNNPALESQHDVGPIPRGMWSLGAPFDSPTHGPFALRLIPHGDTVTFGRNGFLMHGDSITHPGEASRGCIVLPPAARHAIWESGDHVLRVTAAPALRPPR